MIDYSGLLEFIKSSELSVWSETIEQQIKAGLCSRRFGDLPAWFAALNDSPRVQAQSIELLNQVKIGDTSEVDATVQQQIELALKALIPWRKGPYSIFGIHVDCEWRSDWKWDRLRPHISPLKNKLVLDVGCGNGYHCWRMLGEGAERVIGIDPSPRFVVQFYMLKKMMDSTNTAPIDILPVGIEALPKKLEAFDTCFSMGILYHRRSPFDHLRELFEALKPGGELVLETLVIDGTLGMTLVPQGRYAKMNNVWFIPSVATLISWLDKAGFIDSQCVNVNLTSLEEQRATDWMLFQSLADFLHPGDSSRTIEGLPAPQRAVLLARKPD